MTKACPWYRPPLWNKSADEPPSQPQVKKKNKTNISNYQREFPPCTIEEDRETSNFEILSYLYHLNKKLNNIKTICKRCSMHLAGKTHLALQVTKWNCGSHFCWPVWWIGSHKTNIIRCGRVSPVCAVCAVPATLAQSWEKNLIIGRTGQLQYFDSMGQRSRSENVI